MKQSDLQTLLDEPAKEAPADRLLVFHDQDLHFFPPL